MLYEPTAQEDIKPALEDVALVLTAPKRARYANT